MVAPQFDVHDDSERIGFLERTDLWNPLLICNSTCSKHKMLIHCWYNVVPPSAILVQYVGPTLNQHRGNAFLLGYDRNQRYSMLMGIQCKSNMERSSKAEPFYNHMDQRGSSRGGGLIRCCSVLYQMLIQLPKQSRCRILAWRLRWTPG